MPARKRKKPRRFEAELKIRAAKAFLQGSGAAVVGRQYGVAAQSVCRWAEQYRSCGEAAFPKSPRNLSSEQLRLLERASGVVKDKPYQDGSISSRKRQRPRYTNEFRLAIVKARLAGIRAAYLSEKFHIDTVAIFKWVRTYAEHGDKAFAEPDLTPRQKELLKAAHRAKRASKREVEIARRKRLEAENQRRPTRNHRQFTSEAKAAVVSARLSWIPVWMVGWECKLHPSLVYLWVRNYEREGIAGLRDSKPRKGAGGRRSGRTRVRVNDPNRASGGTRRGAGDGNNPYNPAMKVAVARARLGGVRTQVLAEQLGLSRLSITAWANAFKRSGARAFKRPRQQLTPKQERLLRQAKDAVLKSAKRRT